MPQAGCTFEKHGVSATVEQHGMHSRFASVSSRDTAPPLRRIIYESLPLQPFWPLQSFWALLQELCPLHELAPADLRLEELTPLDGRAPSWKIVAVVTNRVPTAEARIAPLVRLFITYSFSVISKLQFSFGTLFVRRRVRSPCEALKQGHSSRLSFSSDLAKDTDVAGDLFSRDEYISKAAGLLVNCLSSNRYQLISLCQPMLVRATNTSDTATCRAHRRQSTKAARVLVGSTCREEKFISLANHSISEVKRP